MMRIFDCFHGITIISYGTNDLVLIARVSRSTLYKKKTKMARKRVGLIGPSSKEKNREKKKKKKVALKDDEEEEWAPEQSPSESEEEEAYEPEPEGPSDESDYEEDKPASTQNKNRLDSKKPPTEPLVVAAAAAASKPELVKVKQEEPTDENGNGEKPVPTTKTRRPYKRKRKTYDFSKDEGLTTEDRITKKGGYAHTQLSRSKIGEANRGNTPWNKGKGRSSADKAKIKAGVQARNRAVLMEKLKRLNMTEEEWYQKKKEIKYLRERIRRGKLKNTKHAVADAELKLKAALDVTINGIKKKEPTEEEKKQEEYLTARRREQTRLKEERERGQKEVLEKLKKARAIKWTPFSFVADDDGNNIPDDGDKAQKANAQKPYTEICPEGGPGGLICCEYCSQKYSSFLNQTVSDMETQKTHKCGKVIKELMQFLEDGIESLDHAMGVARRKTPPLLRRPMPGPNVAIANNHMDPNENTITTSSIAEQQKQPLKSLSKKQRREKESSGNHVDEWNLTSAIDIDLNAGVEMI